ncbi:LPS biosynthesis-related glycosyltransferase [Longimycelium tulufanense]|uniref:LPS biosynthesis-related glycosyltransferase n=1 Tax=Longimycelium tulufanense TaxID=907463 RepID=A0A8J3C908_9PSEU|nr:glycosyltransferase family 9 protein [Longimycelium tulufanense]GGM36639.1 LPS biosynthesis-related glycosyltransferase [Longimycelium tulufanense]
MSVLQPLAPDRDHSRGVGALGELLPGVRRILVLRGGGVGDFVLTLPALQALRDSYPDAEITLLGPAWQGELLDGRPGPVDRTWTLPPVRGLNGDGPDPDSAELAEFFALARLERFDLAVQLHGGGRWSNPFLRRLGARYTVGAREADAEPLDRWLPYHYYQHEALRHLEVVGLAGAAPTALQPRLQVTEADLAEADRALSGLPRALLAVHPGAGDRRRRWPTERFATVAAKMVECGAGVVVVGDDRDSDVADLVVGQCCEAVPLADWPLVRTLAGKVSLGGLLGVFARSTVLVGNDSGPRHLAQAVGVPTVSVYWCGNVINAGPFGRGEHRVHVAWTTQCPECGLSCTDPSAERCPHDVSFVAEVDEAAVLADVIDLWAGVKSRR